MPKDQNIPLDYIIIGGGPAGLQAAYCMQKNKSSYIVLEKAAVAGNFFNTFPRHGKLISINKVYTGTDDHETNLRWDWNSLLCDDPTLAFKHYSKEYFPAANTLVNYLGDYAEKNQLNVQFNTHVVHIEKEDYFILTDQEGCHYHAQNIIVATGFYKPYLPTIPGIELVECYNDVSTNPEDYCNQHVLIIGKGNSAFETADNLVSTAASIHLISPNSIKMAWKTHYVGHLRAVNNNILDTYHLKSQNVILDATIQSIVKEGNQFIVTVAYAHAEGEIEVLRYDRVIACTGFRFDTDMFADECMPRLCSNKKLPVQTSSWESANVPGLFFAGTLMQYLDYKKYMSGFIHGFRYNVQSLCENLFARYQNHARPQKRLPLTLPELVNTIIQRVNHASGLWQQPGFLVDVLSIDTDNNCANYSKLLSMPYTLEHICNQGAHFIISLEFGKQDASDPFSINRINRTNTSEANRSTFLHPVIRYYVDAKLIGEHHVIEDLLGVWNEPEHVEPLLNYVQAQLKQLIDL
ncbi:MAG: NAD(P)-binding domain-containing protein [Legionellaceae bacterium]|nr:NAD(P)-binding domain-containing protein [Legionellaceae bacterium]